MQKIAVIGSGVAGKGIVQTFATYGFEIILKSRTQKALDDAIQSIEQSLPKRIKPEEKDKILNNIKLTTEFEQLKNSNMVIEAIVEDLNKKKDLFRELNNVINENAIIATNTSSLSINDMSINQNFVGIHFFNPVPKMRLVEVIQGKNTSNNTINYVKNILNTIGKKIIILKDSPCFVVNRIMVVSINEAIWELYEGVAFMEDIDNAITLGLNHPMGPFALADLIGLDILLSIMFNLYDATKDKKYSPCPLLINMVKEGKLGKKNKRGFYEYPG